jgi:hypothetical protein
VPETVDLLVLRSNEIDSLLENERSQVHSILLVLLSMRSPRLWADTA